MTMAYATLTGPITLPGSDIGVRARIIATPLTTDQLLTYTGDDRFTAGPVVGETNGIGALNGMKVPTNSDLPGLLWQITAERLDKGPGPAKWTIKHAVAITGTGTVKLRDLVEVDVLTVDSTLVASVSDLAAAADASKTAAAGSATTAAGWADAAASSAADADTSADLAAGSQATASTAASTATTKAGEAAGSATAAAGSATTASGAATTATAKAGEASTSAADAAASKTAAQGYAAQAAGSVSLVAWAPTTVYAAGDVRQAPDGSTIKRTANGTSRASFDATEEAAWTAVAADGTTIVGKALTASYARKKRTDAQVAFNPPLLADPPPPPSPVVQTLNAFPASPVVPTVTEARTMVTFKGGVCELVNTTSSVNGATIQAWRNTQPIFQGASGQQSIFAVEFDIMDATNPLEVALRLRDNFSSNGCKLWTWVDGVPQTADYISCGVTPGGDNFNWHLNLGAGATGRRRVKVYLHNCDFSGLNLKATSLVQPTPSGELKFGFLADSWGAGANTVLPGRTYLRTAARLLGAEAYVEAQGGTGYVEHTTNPSLAAYGNRLTKLATSPIDYLVIAGSLNDDVNNDASPATIQAAAAACYASWATLRPDVPIIVVGVQSVGTAPSTGDSNADRIANNNAVKAAAAAAPNVLGFIDMLGEKWMTGTGYIGSTTGVGPSDWAMDSVYHPSVAGADMIAQRLATRITDILKAA